MSARDPDAIETIVDGPEVELRVRGSRFLAQAFAAADEDAAARCLARLRRRYHDATHHCSALRLGPPEAPLERSDDDGEPSGTAGPPILRAIQREDVLGVLIVVTRYFGGTKLGTGGLVRAYADVAADALGAAPRRTVWQEASLDLRCEYADVGAVESILARAKDAVRGVDRTFEPSPRLVIRVRRSRAPALAAELVDATGGRARVCGTDDGA